MSHLTKVAGTWRNSKPYTKVAGTWKLADYVYNKVGGRWYTSFVKGGLVDKSWDDRDQTGVFGAGVTVGGYSRTMTLQSDGKSIIGGSFSQWNGTNVGRIVRLNSDGTLDTTFTTNNGTGANASFVYEIAVQSDGKILVCGQFTAWNGTTVGRIVRLNSDGTLDTAFTTNTGTGANNIVHSIAIQSDGKIVVCGSFTTWNGTTVGRIVRLNSDGTRDTAFTTNTGTGANNAILSMIIQPDGKILLGGNSGFFTAWNGTSVGAIVRLNSDGTRDTAFTTNTGTGGNNYIYIRAVQSDGKILIGGTVTNWKGTTVGRIVRLNSNGTLDTTFTTNTGTGANNSTASIAIQSDGKILVGGYFTAWNGTSINRIVRLNSDGTRDTTFTTNNGTGASGSVDSIAIQPDGKILVVGSFLAWNGTSVGRIVRLNSDGTNSETSSSFANNTVYSIAIQSDGKIVIGGSFTTWNVTTVGRIVRLNSNGTLDTTFTTNTGTGAASTNNTVDSIAIQSDGKILVGGSFTTWNGTTVNRIVRLNSDGTRDTAFTTNTGTGTDNSIRSIAIQSDGKILVGGSFTTWNGTTVGRIVRLNSDGTRDTDFTTNTGTGANSVVSSNSIAIQSDGKIVVCGSFSQWNGTIVGRIVRLNSDGTRDTDFTTNTGTGANNSVLPITVQPDGKILVSGHFTAWNGTTVGRIVRLNSDGTLDTTFTTNTGTGTNNIIRSIAVQSDGKILVSGQFTSWNGTNVGYIVRLNSDGTRDTTFTTNNGTGANNIVYSIAIQPDGKILVGGQFTAFGLLTEFRRNFVRIGGEDAS
jgi:uncharacterized delta-60 repeat protein